MGSVRCSRCGFVSFADAEHCKRCGNVLPAGMGAAGAWQGEGTQQAYAAPRPGFYAGPKVRKGLAVASLVLGVLGFFTAGLLFVGALAGIALGVVARARATSRPAEYGGRGLATAGIVLNAVSVVMIPFVAIIAAIAIPNLLASYRAANEAAAIGSIRAITLAENDYSGKNGRDMYGTLSELRASGLIDSELVGSTKHGYRFDIETSLGSFVVTATPIKCPNSGTRSFFYSSEDGDLHACDCRSGQADVNSLTIPGYYYKTFVLEGTPHPKQRQ